MVVAGCRRVVLRFGSRTNLLRMRLDRTSCRSTLRSIGRAGMCLLAFRHRRGPPVSLIVRRHIAATREKENQE